jgi:hypothetical protein
MDDALQSSGRGGYTSEGKFQRASIMGLEAHHSEGEGMKATLDEVVKQKRAIAPVQSLSRLVPVRPAPLPGSHRRASLTAGEGTMACTETGFALPCWH